MVEDTSEIREMNRRRAAWVGRGMLIVGALAMLAGLVIFVVSRDEGQALTWAFIGAILFATAGPGVRRYRCWPRRVR